MARRSYPGFSGKEQNSRFHQLQQVIQALKQQTASSSSHHHKRVSWYDILFMKCSSSFTPDATRRTPSKRLSRQSTEYFLLKSWGASVFFFFSQCEMGLWVLLGFGCRTLPCLPFVSLLLNHKLWGLQSFRWCSGIFWDLLDELLMRSWRLIWIAFSP